MMANDGCNDPEPYKNIFNLLSQDGFLEISITADLDEIISTKNLSEYHPATFQINSSEYDNSIYKVKLKARGKYRKKICDFPPIKINFITSEFSGLDLETHESLKLVTHCKESEESEELILREYLAYKIYNKITDNSLRVQLVKINWIDQSGKNDIGVKWGFLIENEDECARRVQSTTVDLQAILHKDLNANGAALTSLYQYMIGNPDWSTAPLKNMFLIKSDDDNGLLPIPYDFDFTGLVNSSYAVTGLGLTSIQERIYLGESSEDELDASIKYLRSKKKMILDEIKSFDYISKSSRRDIIVYIKSFYTTLHEPLRGVEYYENRLKKKR